jgi:hypothetical protein
MNGHVLPRPLVAVALAVVLVGVALLWASLFAGSTWGIAGIVAFVVLVLGRLTVAAVGPRRLGAKVKGAGLLALAVLVAGLSVAGIKLLMSTFRGP